ncbi:MAG: NUMOD3 domain-containing DNA-binding protein [Methylococcales bacterium]|jgi:hypothetical protein
MYYTYIHARPDGTPFYVGKGSKRRAWKLIYRNKHHQSIIDKYGRDNILVGKLDCSSENIAFDLEKGIIKCLKRSGIPLANMTDGGEGISNPSPELRQRLSDSHKGQIISEYTKQRLREVHKGNMYNLGRVLSEEHKQSISKGNIGRVVSDETRKRMSEAHKGSTITEETRQKLRDSHIGKKPSAETLKKMGDAHKKRYIALKQEALQCHGSNL